MPAKRWNISLKSRWKILEVSVASLGDISGGPVQRETMAISALPGLAFIDFGTPGLLTPFVGWRLILKDSTLKTLEGIIGAAGTTEVLDTPLNDDPDFDAAGSWVRNAGWTVSGGKATFSGGNSGSGVYQQKTHVKWTCYKVTAVCDSISSGGFNLQVEDYTQSIIKDMGPFTVPGTHIIYRTAEQATGSRQTGLVCGINGSGGVFDSFRTQKVLAPGPTGVTIIDAPGSSTQSWTVHTSGFNLYDYTGYTYG